MARSLAAPALVLAALASVARAVRVFAIDDLAPARAALPEDLVRRALALLPPPVAFCSDGREVQLHLGGPATRPVERWPQEFRVVRLQFFPAGDRLMCVGRSVAGVWDVWASRSVAALRHEGLLDVQIFPGGDRVVTLGADSRAVVWSVSDAEVLRAWRVRHGHSAVRVLRSGNRLATGIGGGSAVLWSAEGGEVVRLQHPGGENVVSLEAASCGEKLGTADLVTVALWDASGGLERVFTRPAETHWQQRLERPCFALSEGGAVVVGRGVTSIFVWDGGTGDLRRTIEFGDLVTTPLVLLSGGGGLLVFTVRGAVTVDFSSGAMHRVSEEFGVVAAAAVPGGDVVAICSEAWAFIGAGGPTPNVEMWQIARRVGVWDASGGHMLYTARSPPYVLHSGESDSPCSVAVGPSLAAMT